MAVNKKLADKLTKIAKRQFDAGMRVKKERMKTVKDIEDLYFNKTIELLDNRINIPFPIMAGQIDTYLSKIDNPPSVSFRVSDLPNFGDKIAAVWKDEQSPMRAAWERKDRAEKKICLISGRGISKVYASSIKNEYKSHYDVVDYHSFICEGRRGHLEDNQYCGEKDIFKTLAEIEKKAELKIYDRKQAILIKNAMKEDGSGNSHDAFQDKFNRMKAMGISPDLNGFTGQKMASLVEWNMIHSGKRYYLLFDPVTMIWLRCEELKEVFSHGKWTWTSWGFNPEEYMFWNKGAGDDILPVAEAMRLILNESIENVRRRNRPMRITGGDQFGDPNELAEYIPDHIILTNAGKQGEIVTIETPEVTTSIDMVQFLDSFMGQKTGVSPELQGASDKDTKVGVFYGTLQQAADRIGNVNKEYSNNYAEKGYHFFWGLKDHMTESKAIEMLGKNGVHMEELTRKELDDVDDVDDIIVSGGSREEEINEIKSQRQSQAISELTGNPVYSQRLNPDWIIKTSLKTAGFNDEDIQQALDTKSAGDTELLKEADAAIREILLDKTPRLNRGATVAFIQHIIDFDIDNLNFEKLNKQGQVIGIDKKNFKRSQRLREYAKAHVNIALQNSQRKARDVSSQLTRANIQGKLQEPASNEAVDLPVPTQQEKQLASARPFETNLSTPEGTSETSQRLSEALTP